MSNVHAKRKYPNLPEDFRVLVRAKRLQLGVTLKVMGDDLNCGPVLLSQLELGKRNFTFEMAKKIRDYLQLDYALPEPDFSQMEPLARNRTSFPVEKDSFLIEVNGEIIEVRSYRRLGRLTNSRPFKT